MAMLMAEMSIRSWTLCFSGTGVAAVQAIEKQEPDSLQKYSFPVESFIFAQNKLYRLWLVTLLYM